MTASPASPLETAAAGSSRSHLADLAAFAGRQVVAGGDVMIVSYDGETLTTLNGRASTDVFAAAAVPWFDTVDETARPEYHIRRLRRRDG